MDKVAEAKKSFYNTLKRNGISVEEYAASRQGMSFIKRAAVLRHFNRLDKSAAKAPAAPTGVGGFFYTMLRHFLEPDDAVGRVGAWTLGGGIGGYGVGRAAGALTSPSEAAVGNLQKQELITEYDAAIEEMNNRLAAQKVMA